MDLFITRPVHPTDYLVDIAVFRKNLVLSYLEDKVGEDFDTRKPLHQNYRHHVIQEPSGTPFLHNRYPGDWVEPVSSIFNSILAGIRKKHLIC